MASDASPSAESAPWVVVLVEGASDAEAVRAAAATRGRDLAADGARLVELGGATGVRRWLAAAGPALDGVAVVGLCDERESADFTRALEPVEGATILVCRADLEDELIRALGVAGVEQVLADHGDLTAFRTLQSQPAHLGRPTERQLRRFLGAGSGRKLRYGRLLVEALLPDAQPEPLRELLDLVSPADGA